MRLLLVEDSPRLARSLVAGLAQAGMVVDAVVDGIQADQLLSGERYEAVVLDLALPRLDGLEVLRRARDRGNDVPVLILTASGETADRVRGLNAGADDYLSKPFDLAELVARLRALGRRTGDARPPVLEAGDVVLDPAKRTATRAGLDLDLTLKEFAVLQALLEAQGAVVTPEELLERAWDEQLDPLSNTVRMTVMTLRRKLGDPPVIQTVRGSGYRV